MKGDIRMRVIRRIAENKNLSLSVARHIYNMKSIKRRQELCEAERTRKTSKVTP